MNREKRYQITKERNESDMICEKIIDTKPTDKPNKLVQATNILEMVLLGASDLTDEITKQNLKDEDYKRIKRHIKNGYKFLKEYYDNR